MQRRVAILALVAGVFAACDGERDDAVPGSAGPAAVEAPAPETGQTLDLFVEAPAPGAQLVFVGDRRSEQAERWPGAIFVPLSTFSVERDGIPNEFPHADRIAAGLEAAGVRGERIVIVGEPIPAGRAWAALDYLGLGARAALLDGGAAALPADGAAPGEGAQPAAPSSGDADLQVEVREDMIVDARWVNEHLRDPDVVILDARPPEEFRGEKPGEGIQRPGHIPGARNVFWETLVQSKASPRLRDATELRRIFEEAGAVPGKTVVAYCRTGGQGSFLYTVARHLGYDVRLYDGSYIDWSRTEYPVER